VERLGHVVVGADAETLDLVPMPARPERIRIGVLIFDTEAAAARRNRTCRQFEVEQDNVVIVELPEIDAFFPEVRRIDVETLDLSINSIDCATALSSSISKTRCQPL